MTAHERQSVTPHLIISICFMCPVPKTIAFGGVATGIINAQLAPIPMIIVNVSFGSPTSAATDAKTGNKSAALAVLLVNSVSAITKLQL